jgi:hypothetical protein
MLWLDIHSPKSEWYWIRSLYFDSLDDTCYFEKLIGQQFRNKYRLRLYNDDPSHIKFELKRKAWEYVQKESIYVDKILTREMIEWNYSWLLEHPSPLLHKIYPYFVTQIYKPKIIISYQREAYTLPINNVRITFDKYLNWTTNTDSFLKAWTLFGKPLVATWKTILEIKYDGFLPDIVRTALTSSAHERNAISKYALWRSSIAYI